MKLFFITLTLIFAGLLPILALAQPPTHEAQEAIYTPDSSVKIAAADLATIDVSQRTYIRYLSLYDISKSLRSQVGGIVSFVCNSLSTRRRIYIPVFVGNSDQTVIRININDYEWSAKIWDDFAAKGSGPRPFPEPYFHAFIDKTISSKIKNQEIKELLSEKISTGDSIVVVVDRAGLFPSDSNRPISTATKGNKFKALDVQAGFVLVNINGKNLWIKTENVRSVTSETVEKEEPQEVDKKKIFAGAPWVDKDALAFLITATQAQSPILRADWFITYATLPPAYYNFLRLGNNIKDFQRLVFTDEALAAKAKSQDKGVVVTSTVARNNRTLTRSPTFTNGYYWTSHDSLKSVDDRQYVQNLLNEKFDATEDIGTLPNGLQAYFLTDGKGKRLDAANTDIAIDNTAVDRIVRTGRSCMICHGEGIKPIEDEVRTLTRKLQNHEEVKLLVTDSKQAYRIDDLFSSDLDAQIVSDQNIYHLAVGRATGLSSELAIRHYAYIWDRYAEKLLGTEEAAREAGIPSYDLERIIRLSNDNVVLGLIKKPIRPLRRDQWEQSFQGLMLIILAQRSGAVPVQPQFSPTLGK